LATLTAGEQLQLPYVRDLRRRGRRGKGEKEGFFSRG
jgi:hypothetical protein